MSVFTVDRDAILVLLCSVFLSVSTSATNYLETRLQNDLLCVRWDVEQTLLIHSLTHSL